MCKLFVTKSSIKSTFARAATGGKEAEGHRVIIGSVYLFMKIIYIFDLDWQVYLK